MVDYREALTELDALAWQSSNLGGLLLLVTGQVGFKLWGLVLLPFVALAWWLWGARASLRVVVDVSILLSVLAAPYGFSYDQVILLVPLISILSWIAARKLGRRQSVLILSVLVLANIASYYTRVTVSNEVYFFWIPLGAIVIYLYALWQVSRVDGRIIRSRSALVSGAVG